MAKQNFWDYLIIGFKLFLVMLLGNLIMLVPMALLSLLNGMMLIGWLIGIVLALALNGYLLVRFKKWIFE